MIQGANKMKGMKNVQFDEKQLVHVEAIIQSMTKEERQDPSLMNASRKKRIARGSGTNVSQVNRLLKQFNDMKKMMKQMTKDRKSTRLNSSHVAISYAVFCLKKKGPKPISNF